MLLRYLSASTISLTLPESLMSLCNGGRAGPPPTRPEVSSLAWVSSSSGARPSARSREYDHERLPAIVLISPLCAMTRNGCVLSHVERVLVEKRRWKRAKRVL